LSRHDELFQRLRDSVLKGRGDTDPGLRRTVEERVATAAGRVGAAPAGPFLRQDGVPEILLAYVDKVALHAYRITQQDIDELQTAGYSEDAIFEISIAAAVGAGAARLERGLAALKAAG
jgi:alkylhydroperoxidase family enzyme